jgi:hypothetical protein
VADAAQDPAAVTCHRVGKYKLAAGGALAVDGACFGVDLLRRAISG